jgi:hypothetical protein
MHVFSVGGRSTSLNLFLLFFFGLKVQKCMRKYEKSSRGFSDVSYDVAKTRLPGLEVRRGCGVRTYVSTWSGGVKGAG